MATTADTDAIASAPVLGRAAAALARPVLARPWLTIGLVLVVGAASVAVATELNFDTRLSALLPESAPEVRELKQVQKKATELRVTRKLRVRQHRYTTPQYGALRAFWLAADKACSARVVLGKGGTP